MYTVEEAASLLSLSRAQVYRLIDSCLIGSVTIGRSRRITLSQLEVFVRHLEGSAATETVRLRSSLGRPVPLLENLGS